VSRTLSPHLTFSTAGNHHVGVVAALGMFAGIQVTKQSPPRGRYAVANGERVGFRAT
jgi:hypothetical protein